VIYAARATPQWSELSSRSKRAVRLLTCEHPLSR